MLRAVLPLRPRGWSRLRAAPGLLLGCGRALRAAAPPGARGLRWAGERRRGGGRVKRAVPGSGSAGGGTARLSAGNLYRRFTTEASQATLASVSPVFAVVSAGG